MQLLFDKSFFFKLKKNSHQNHDENGITTSEIDNYHRMITNPSAPSYDYVQSEPMLNTNKKLKKILTKKWIYRSLVFLLLCIAIAILLIVFLTGKYFSLI